MAEGGEVVVMEEEEEEADGAEDEGEYTATVGSAAEPRDLTPAMDEAAAEEEAAALAAAQEEEEEEEEEADRYKAAGVSFDDDQTESEDEEEVAAKKKEQTNASPPVAPITSPPKPSPPKWMREAKVAEPAAVDEVDESTAWLVFEGDGEVRTSSQQCELSIPHTIRLQLEDGGSEVIVGRADECDVRMDCPPPHLNMISRKHCKFTRKFDAWHLEDLGSSNGTVVNGAKLRHNKKVRLSVGDKVTFGSKRYSEARYRLSRERPAGGD